MEPEDSLPQSQVPSTCPYPEPARSSPQIPTSHFLAAAVKGTCQIQAPNFPRTKSHVLFRCLGCTKVSVQVRGLLWLFRNMTRFYCEELLAPRPNPKPEDHPLSTVGDCLFNIFASYPSYWRPFLHPQPEDAPCRCDRDPLIRLHTPRFAVSVINLLQI